MTVPERRQQVFVSSTYLDLQAERQAAVQAILNAGHIPAGMELFAAGDQSQLEVIKRWIEHSDIFMLILGGRYGCIEKASGKSYIHLEYEHAVSLGKPFFAVYMTEECLERRLKEDGLKVIERDHTEKFEEFRSLVKSRMCLAFNDPKDIKIAVQQTLPDLIHRHHLRGWVRAGAADETSTLIGQIKELQAKVNALQMRSEPDYNGATFEEVCETLSDISITASQSSRVPVGTGLSAFRTAFEHDTNVDTTYRTWEISHWRCTLERFGLVTLHDNLSMSLTDNGHRFHYRLKKTR